MVIVLLLVNLVRVPTGLESHRKRAACGLDLGLHLAQRCTTNVLALNRHNSHVDLQATLCCMGAFAYLLDSDRLSDGRNLCLCLVPFFELNNVYVAAAVSIHRSHGCRNIRRLRRSPHARKHLRNLLVIQHTVRIRVCFQPNAIEVVCSAKRDAKRTRRFKSHLHAL